MSKLIHSVSLDAFKIAFKDWSSDSSSVYRTVAFTDDGYLYTHGKVFKMSDVTEGEGNIGLTAFSRNGLAINITVSGISKNLDLPQLATTTNDILDVTNPTANLEGYSIAHKTSLDAGGTSISTISKYVLTSYGVKYDKYGHITGTVTGTPTHIDYVNQTLDNATTTAQYLLFGNSATTTTGASKFSTKISAIASSGTLRASVFEEGGTTLENKYAPKSLTTTYATGSQYGLVLLSDSIVSSSGVSDHIAATPKAVKDALASAKSYADGMLAANDAMVFKGTLGTNGTVTTLPISGYSAGWTYRVITAGAYAGQKCEVGDLIIAIKDFTSSAANDDWTVVQTNIDGAVTSNATLTTDQLIVGGGGSTVKTLNIGSTGMVLKVVNGKPTWQNHITTRAITIDGAAFLAANTSTAFNIKQGSNVSLVKDSSGNLTISATGFLSSTNPLTIYSKGATSSIGEYNPGEGEASFDFTNGLMASLSGSKFTIGHSNTISAKTTAELGKIKYDANGHITGFEAVSSLKNPHSLVLKIKSGTTEGTDLYTYDGSSTKTLDIKAGSNISLSAVAGALTIAATNTTYKLIAGLNTSTGNAVSTNGATYIRLLTSTNSNAGSLKIIGTGSTSVSSDASGNITINSINTWRPVYAWKLSDMDSAGDTIDNILANSTDTKSLRFGSSFAYNDSLGETAELDLVWAEIDKSGSITYKI